ncbi:MAG: NAD(P)-dependent oxidoreductase [Acidimicrobiia bacterium]
MGASGIAVIGLGLMGSQLASRLLSAGFEVHGFDPSPRASADFENGGGIPASSPAEAVSGCWGALLSLPDSDVSRKVCLGPRGLAEAGVSSLYIYDTTTGRPQDATSLAEALDRHGLTYCDSTLSGNSESARRGDLVVMVGGSPQAYRTGLPIFESIGRSHHHVGGPGSGSVMKLIVNHILMIHRLALGEALAVAELSELDLSATLNVLRDSLAYSKAMDSWGDRMVDGDHGDPSSRIRQSHKDSLLIVDHALELGASVDLVEVVQTALEEAKATGLGELDNSAMIEVVRRRAGIGRVNTDDSLLDSPAPPDNESDTVPTEEITD